MIDRRSCARPPARLSWAGLDPRETFNAHLESNRGTREGGGRGTGVSLLPLLPSLSRDEITMQSRAAFWVGDAAQRAGGSEEKGETDGKKQTQGIMPAPYA